MSDYGSPDADHTAALTAVDEARQDALTAVSEMRQHGAPPHHPNLAPTDGQKELATICTQKVVDYLLQLRPYRENSQNWNTDLGTLHLPKELGTPGSKRRSGGVTQNLWLCRQPEIPLRNVSEVIKAANMTVQYSTMRGEQFSPTPTAGGMTVVTSSEQQQQQQEDRESNYVPAKPATSSSAGLGRGSSHETKPFNLVFSDRTLLELVELGDEVAAEIDILIELEAPDYESGSQGAV